jgi:thymidylate synthase ThyX
MFDEIKVELLSSWQGKKGGDGAIAHAAWASTFDIEKLSSKTNDDIRRITTNVVQFHHDTPKERVWMEFFITCPIFIERMLDKYRMTQQYQDFRVEFSFAPMGRDHITQNELSGRYRTIPDRSYGLPKDVDVICEKAHNNGRANWGQDWSSLLKMQYEEYSGRLQILKKAEIEGKITNAEYRRAREVWRGILGTAFLTDMRIVMNLNAFEHIINQRLAKDAQNECRAVAYLMLNEVVKNEVAPVTIEQMILTNKWEVLISDVQQLLET